MEVKSCLGVFTGDSRKVDLIARCESETTILQIDVNGLPFGAIVGGVIGGLVVIAVIIVVVVIYRRKRGIEAGTDEEVPGAELDEESEAARTDSDCADPVIAFPAGTSVEPALSDFNELHSCESHSNKCAVVTHYEHVTR